MLNRCIFRCEGCTKYKRSYESLLFSLVPQDMLYVRQSQTMEPTSLKPCHEKLLVPWTPSSCARISPDLVSILEMPLMCALHTLCWDPLSSWGFQPMLANGLFSAILQKGPARGAWLVQQPWQSPCALWCGQKLR